MEDGTNGDRAAKSPSEVSADAVRRRTEEYVAAYNAGDVTKMAAFYTPDCFFVAPGRDFIRGPEGFLKCGIIKQMMDLGGKRIQIKPADIVAAPDSVSFVATFSLYNKAGKEIDDGRIVNVWVKVDDEWLLKYDIFN